MKVSGSFLWCTCTCFFIVFLITSCQKEYSFEGGLQAQYVISGAPMDCSPAVVSGFYIAGVPTDNSNTVQLSIDVTTAGNYTIFTIPSHGISFIASGNFSDTGTQVVTLQCRGTPDSVGNIIIKIPGDNGCTFSLNVLKKAPASYTLAGYPNDCSNPVVAGTFTAGNNLTPGNIVTLQVIINTPGDYTIKTDTIDGISFSSSGHFNAAGTQAVVLSGTGVPDASGLIYFNVEADSSQCSFSIPVQDAAPVATYVLQSGTGASGLVCSPHSLQGTYTAGVSLNGSHTITVTPYATTGGNYTISTGKINGMIFSASGTFPNAGEYSVVLRGSGKPIIPGSFTFTAFIIGPAPIGGESCGVTLTVQ